MAMSYEDLQDLLEEVSSSRIVGLSSKDGISPFNAEQTIAVTHALRKNPSLEHLTFFFARESHNCKKILVGALENSFLQKLVLRLSGSDDAESLAESLRRNTTLKELCLSSGYSHLGNDSLVKKVSDNAIKIITEAIKTHPSIQRFYMEGGWLISEDAKAFSQVLEQSKSLKDLELSNNNIGCDGAEVIASSLARNSTLEVLNLNGAGIGSRGTIALAETLKTNTSLRRLHLNGNEIGLRGFRALSSTLDFNFNILFIELSSSPSSLIGDEIAAIRVKLQRNKDLQEREEQASEDALKRVVVTEQQIAAAPLIAGDNAHFLAAGSSLSSSRAANSVDFQSSLVYFPDDCYCSITLELIDDPATASDNHTYERSAIIDWFSRGNKTSPKTGEPLSNFELRPNLALKMVIDSLREKRDEVKRQEESQRRIDSARKEAEDTKSLEEEARRKRDIEERELSHEAVQSGRNDLTSSSKLPSSTLK